MWVSLFSYYTWGDGVAYMLSTQTLVFHLTHLLFLNAMLNIKQKTAKAIPAMAAMEYTETSTRLFGCNFSLAAPSYGTSPVQGRGCGKGGTLGRGGHKKVCIQLI
jgi:hypothetical protein